jgi:hypothetical protein
MMAFLYWHPSCTQGRNPAHRLPEAPVAGLAVCSEASHIQVHYLKVVTYERRLLVVHTKPARFDKDGHMRHWNNKWGAPHHLDVY